MIETRNKVLERYMYFCDNKIKNNKWAYADKNHFGIMRETEKACYVNFSIIDLREFDVKSDERIYPDGTFNNDTYIYFWCPKKFMGYKMDAIPYWFLKEKINEFLSSK